MNDSIKPGLSFPFLRKKKEKPCFYLQSLKAHVYFITFYSICKGMMKNKSDSLGENTVYFSEKHLTFFSFSI